MDSTVSNATVRLQYLVTSENSDTVSIQDIPEAHGAVTGACGHIVGVRMKACAGDVS